jgi:hypothetical protein
MKFVVIDDNEILYHSPLGLETVSALQSLLREARCFSPSFADLDPYLIETYVVQFARHRNEVRFLIDRNIYSQVLALANGDHITEQMRLAAGIMAFASCANAQIEPNLALYEGFASGALGSWKDDLGLSGEQTRSTPATGQLWRLDTRRDSSDKSPAAALNQTSPKSSIREAR